MKRILSPRTRKSRKTAVRLFTGKGLFDDLPKRKRAEEMYKDLVQGIKNWGTTGYLLRNKKFLQAQSKKNLIGFIMFLGNEYYKLYKSKLPRLRKTNNPKRIVEYADTRPGTQYDKQGRMVSFGTPRIIDLSPKALQRHGYGKKTTKRKRKKLTGAAKAKFLARMNKGRRKKGLKPIRSR